MSKKLKGKEKIKVGILQKFIEKEIKFKKGLLGTSHKIRINPRNIQILYNGMGETRTVITFWDEDGAIEILKKAIEVFEELKKECIVKG